MRPERAADLSVVRRELEDVEAILADIPPDRPTQRRGLEQRAARLREQLAEIEESVDPR